MADNFPSDFIPNFDDDAPDEQYDGAAADSDNSGDSLAELNAASLLTPDILSQLAPELSSLDRQPADLLFEEPPVEEGDTGVPLPERRTGLEKPAKPSAPPSSGTPEDEPAAEAVVKEDTVEAEVDKREATTPVFDFLNDQTPQLVESSSAMEDAPSDSVGVPAPLPIEPDVEDQFGRSELSTEPAPPDPEEIKPADAPRSGPADREDVIVRVFFPRPPGDEPSPARASIAQEPDSMLDLLTRGGKASTDYEIVEPTGPDFSTTHPLPIPDVPLVEILPEVEDPVKIETRPHPKPDIEVDAVDELLSDMEDIPTPVGTDAPSMSDFTWEEMQQAPVVQEALQRESVEPVPAPAFAPPDVESRSKPRRRGLLIWLVVGTIAAVLIIAALFGLWGVVGQSIDDTLAGLLGERPTETPPLGVLLEPTIMVEEASSPQPTAPPEPTATPQPDTVLTDNGILQQDVPMVFVPGGTFEMGSDAQSHRVTLSPFFIDTYEVTNAAYARCVEADGCTEPESLENYAGDTYYGAPAFLEHPVINITWEQANTYCEWRGARLPTEAEWEMAARVNIETGVQTVYPWGSQWDPSRLNYCDASCVLAANADPGYNDTWPQTARVGSFPTGSGGVGTLDMAGNVSEWVADWFAADYYLASPEQDPLGPESGEDRVIRGGAWGVSNPSLFLSTARTHFNPDSSGPGTGFRCAVYDADVEGLPATDVQEDT